MGFLDNNGLKYLWRQILSKLSECVDWDSFNGIVGNTPVSDQINDAVSNKMDKENPTGTGSFSLNRKAGTTIGDYSFAEGCGTTASGNFSHAEGHNTVASNIRSHAEGFNTTSSGNGSHAEGIDTIASGLSSHAEGSYSSASGRDSHAEGYRTTAPGQSSHAEGSATQAGLKVFSVENFAQDRFTLSSVEGLAVGMYYSLITSGNIYSKYGSIMSIDANANTITVDTFPEDAQSANYIFIEADKTLGDTVVGDQSHAEGEGAVASGSRSHAEGYNTKASGGNSHAEGIDTIASGLSSHAEGSYSSASGRDSHAEGYRTTAPGQSSHAEGYFTTASSTYQHVQGKYNIEGNYADIIGNGDTASGRSNAATVDWSGNAWYAGDVYVGSTSGTNKDAGSKKLATEEYVTSEDTLHKLGLLYRKGDVAVFSNFTWPGLLTGGGKDIVVGIHFSKLLASDITKASIQSGSVIVRQNGNYLIGTASNKKDIASTFASTVLDLSIDSNNDTERIGYMKLSLSSSPKNATNNDDLSVAFYGLKVKFA